MKIAQVLLSPRIGGAETLAAGLKRNWEERGHYVSDLYLDGVDEPRTNRERLLHLRSALAAGRFDAVLAHSALPIVYAGLSSGSTPVVAVLHSSHDDYASMKLRVGHRLALRRIVSAIAVSEVARECYAKHFPKEARAVRVVPNGIDTSRFTSSGLRGDIDGPYDYPLRLVSVSRLVPVKRIEVAIRAVQLMNQTGTPTSLTVVGGGDPEYEAHLRALAGSSGAVASMIRFAGAQSDVVPFLRESHGLVHCSERESFGLALVEAACMGLPIFVGNRLDWVPDGAVAFVHRDGDSGSLASSVREFDEDRSSFLRVAHGRSQEIQRRYSVDACADAYLSLLEEAAHQRRHRE